MYGAILGDIIGSPYEFNRGSKAKDFPLFSEASCFTDDTVMTVAVAEAFLDATEDADGIRQRLVQSMRRWGRLYPEAGYGIRFRKWLESSNPQPYNSCGNGSAMRVSSIPWLYGDLDTVRRRTQQGCHPSLHGKGLLLRSQPYL